MCLFIIHLGDYYILWCALLWPQEKEWRGGDGGSSESSDIVYLYNNDVYIMSQSVMNLTILLSPYI